MKTVKILFWKYLFMGSSAVGLAFLKLSSYAMHNAMLLMPEPEDPVPASSYSEFIKGVEGGDKKGS